MYISLTVCFIKSLKRLRETTALALCKTEASVFHTVVR